MAEFKPVQRGQAFAPSAADWNAMQEAAKRVLSDGGRTGGRGHAAGAYPNVVQVKNMSGLTIPQYWAVGADGVLTPPTGTNSNFHEFITNVTIKVVTPNAAHAGRWFVTLDSIQDGKIGSAVSLGVVPCRVNMRGTADRCCDVLIPNPSTSSSSSGSGSSGGLVPNSGSSGYEILWVAGGVGTATATGEQWALLRLAGVDKHPTVKITVSYGDGVYDGMILGDFAGDIDFADDAGTDRFPCMIINRGEQGGNTSPLPVGNVYEGKLIHTNADGTPVVSLQICHVEACEE